MSTCRVCILGHPPPMPSASGSSSRGFRRAWCEEHKQVRNQGTSRMKTRCMEGLRCCQADITVGRRGVIGVSKTQDLQFAHRRQQRSFESGVPTKNIYIRSVALIASADERTRFQNTSEPASGLLKRGKNGRLPRVWRQRKEDPRRSSKTLLRKAKPPNHAQLAVWRS